MYRHIHFGIESRNYAIPMDFKGFRITVGFPLPWKGIQLNDSCSMCQDLQKPMISLIICCDSWARCRDRSVSCPGTFLPGCAKASFYQLFLRVLNNRRIPEHVFFLPWQKPSFSYGFTRFSGVRGGHVFFRRSQWQAYMG